MDHHHHKPGCLYTCELCLKAFDSPTKLNTHTEVHRRKFFLFLFHRTGQSVHFVKRLTCPISGCTKVFTTAGGLQYHMQHGHSVKHKSIPCPASDCDKLFSSIGGLRTHYSAYPTHRPSPSLPQSEPKLPTDELGNCFDPLFVSALAEELLF